MFERMFKYFEQRSMRVRRECKMQNFISFLLVLIIFEISKKKFFIPRHVNPNYNKFGAFIFGRRGHRNHEYLKTQFFGRMRALWNWNLQIILSFIENVPSRDELCLAGYTQSSVPGELKHFFLIRNRFNARSQLFPCNKGKIMFKSW